MNDPILPEREQATMIEYRVINMRGRPRHSGIYSTALLGDDALKSALAAQAARGGQIEFRTITQTPWTPYRFND